jgi:hypothetical protein
MRRNPILGSNTYKTNSLSAAATRSKRLLSGQSAAFSSGNSDSEKLFCEVHNPSHDRLTVCFLLESRIPVRVNIIQPRNSQDRFTAERVARTRPKTYRAIVRLLAEPDAKVEHIAQRQRVSTHTVRAIRQREAVAIAERKKSLAAMLANVAELGASRMEETIGKASLRDAAIGTGIAVDKMLALTGESPALQIANIVMPTEADRAKQRAIDDKLDAIFRRLATRDGDAP